MSEVFFESFRQAINLIFSGDPLFYEIVFRTFYTAGVGVALACIWSIPLAIAIGLYNFKGRWVLKGLFNALIGIPTVALGLLLYLLWSNTGPLHNFGGSVFLYSINGIAIGQAILVTPIIVSFVGNALNAADIQLRDLARTLGASGFRTNLAILKETIWSVVLAVSASFNRGFGELGIATIVGGSLIGRTTVLTTSIVLATGFGEFAIAMAYGIVLMGIVIAITLIINLVERLKREDVTMPKWGLLKSIIGERFK